MIEIPMSFLIWIGFIIIGLIVIYGLFLSIKDKDWYGGVLCSAGLTVLLIGSLTLLGVIIWV